MIGLRIQVLGLGSTIQVLRFRIQVLGAMVGLNTLGDMQVRFQVGSEHPSDWIQDPSALEPWLDCGSDHPSDRMQSENKPGIILEGRSGPPPFQVKIDLARIRVETLN